MFPNRVANATSQLRAVDRVCDEFEAAWKKGHRPELGDYLQRLPESSREEGLADLLELDLVYRSRCGESPRISDYTATFSGMASVVVRVFDAATSRRETGAISGHSVATDSNNSGTLPVITGLTILKKAGSGGMGIVYQAWDDQLKRMVAVKMLRPGTDSDSATVLRFRREAESAARLSHPNIVPIFCVGIHQNLPFLVMPFVEGGTLRDRIQKQLPTVQEAARIVVKLATAVSHAHDRGVIHRDLKPANILMQAATSASRIGAVTTEYPNTLSEPAITDFGLSRIQDAVDSEQTQSGAILGTPNYLSPEQASGHSKHVDHRTDIYALGAILYELLTGRPPHQADSLAETLHAIRTRDPVDPSQLRSEIPRDLETICLRCLAREPHLRYATAQSLADDLQCFLAQRPVVARRISRLQKTIRLIRLHPRRTILAIALMGLMAVSVAFSVAAWSRERKNQDHLFRTELLSITRELELLDREEFEFVPVVDPLKRRTLRELATRCSLLLEKPHDLSLLRRQLADVQHRLGTACELAGEVSDAEQAYRRAILFLGDQPADAESLGKLAMIRISLGRLLQRTGQLEESERSLRSAAAWASGSGMEGSTLSVRAIQSLSEHLLLTTRFEEAESLILKAIDLGRKQAEARPKDSVVQMTLANARLTLSDLRFLFSRNEEARQQCELAIIEIDALVKTSPLPQRQFLLARALACRAAALEALGRTADSHADSIRRHELLTGLANSFPERPDYRVDAALSLHDASRLGVTLPGETNYVPGTDNVPLEERLRKAMEIQRQYATDFPTLKENLRRLATTQNSLATWLTDKADYVQDVSQQQAALSEAEALHRASEDTWATLVKTYPSVWKYRFDLARSHQRLGITLTRLGKKEEAKSVYRLSLAMQSEFSQQHPNISRCKLSMAALQNNLGVLSDQDMDNANAEIAFREAVRIGKLALQSDSSHPTYRLLVSQFTDNLIEILLRTGRHSEAVPLVGEVHDLWTPDDWWNYEKLLTRHQTIADALQNDGTLSDSERKMILTILQDRTIAWVRGLIPRIHTAASDFPHFLQTHPAFAHVRSRSEFTELQEEAARRYSRP